MVSPTQLCWRYHGLPIRQWFDISRYRKDTFNTMPSMVNYWPSGVGISAKISVKVHMLQMQSRYYSSPIICIILEWFWKKYTEKKQFTNYTIHIVNLGFINARYNSLNPERCGIYQTTTKRAFQWALSVSWIDSNSSSMDNYFHYKTWNEITYPLPNFHGCWPFWSW